MVFVLIYLCLTSQTDMKPGVDLIGEGIDLEFLRQQTQQAVLIKGRKAKPSYREAVHIRSIDRTSRFPTGHENTCDGL